MKDTAKELVEFIKSGGTLVDEKTKEKRLSICNDCEYLKDGQCTICFCFVEIKTATKTHPLSAFDFDCPRWKIPYRFLKGITTLIKHSITGTENVTKCPKKYW